MEHDLGAPRDAFCIVLAGRRDLEAGPAGRGPAPDFTGARTAAQDNDALGHHERRVEANAELADQAGAVLGLGHTRQEGSCAGARDGAEIVDQLLPVHADAAVGHDKRIVFLVRRDPDFRRLAIGDQRRAGDRLIAQLVAGVGSVRDQFAQENVGFRIDRMHHQVQQLGNLGLERLG